MNLKLHPKVFLLFLCLFLSHIINAQNVGIGTTKPLTPLHIKANAEALRIQGFSPWIGFTDNTADSVTYDGFVYFPDTSLVLGSRAGTNMPVILAPNNAAVLYVTSASNVGIGTPTPTQALDVNGSVRIRGGNPAAGSVLVSTDANGDASWQTNTGGNGILVDTMTVKPASWIWNSQYSFETSSGSYTEYFTRYVEIPITQLTNAFLTGGGSVQVYLNPNPLANTLMWTPLPYIFTDGSEDFNYNIAFETTPGVLILHYFFVQLVSTATIPTLSDYAIPAYKFKIVLQQGTMIN